MGSDSDRRAISSKDDTVRLAGSPSVPLPPLPDPPFRWGSLEVRDRLGSGAFGDVYLAWDPRLEREVALKLLRPRGGESDASRDARVEEARLLARIRNEHVVTVHGADRVEGRVGISMELLRGRTLAEILRAEGPMGAREAAAIGIDVAKALAAIHGAGMIHRDVKAQNVFREEAGRIVLGDFGASVDLGEATARGDASLSGTPLYLSPEALEGKPSTARGDLYALGVLLFHLLTGGFPVEGRTLEALRGAHRRGARRSIRDARPDLPRPLARVIERALEPDPKRRFATAGEMESALEAAVGGGTPADAERRRFGISLRLGPLQISIVASVVAVIAFAVVVPLREREAPAPAPWVEPAPAPAPPPPRSPAPVPSRGAPPSSGETGGAIRASASVTSIEGALTLSLAISSPGDLHAYVILTDEDGGIRLLFPGSDGEPSNPVRGDGLRELPLGIRAEGAGRGARLVVVLSVTSMPAIESAPEDALPSLLRRERPADVMETDAVGIWVRSIPIAPP